MEYATIRQGDDESGAEFIHRFTRLVSVLGEAAGSVESQVEKCKWAVNDRIRKSAVTARFRDLTEIADFIKIRELERKDYEDRTGNKKRDREGNPKRIVGSGSHGGQDEAPLPLNEVPVVPAVGTNQRPRCEACGRQHPGICYRVTGGCFRCGDQGHQVRECTRPPVGRNVLAIEAPPNIGGRVVARAVNPVPNNPEGNRPH